MKRTTLNPLVVTCLAGLFSYLVGAGCTGPVDVVDPIHLSFVPEVLELQAQVGSTSAGKRRVLLTWRYDTLNTNIRTWDIQRSINDTTIASLSFLDFVRKPALGSPFYADSSSQFQGIQSDSLDVYYRVIPNGDLRNYVGRPSAILHVIVPR
ncbi:MAG: hypothetical protein MUE68_09780 [Bacteroidetes bacterium]|jgi:hypothetical protein|nr:hypothetical protein [Bacteroidota bacterium]